jgi:cobalt-zinc-cadmium efflux system outer membrane protein
MAKIYFTLLFIICMCFCRSQALPGSVQDTVAMNIQQAEDSFLVNNLALIAQHYSIDSAKATVITARLWDNPEFDYTNGFYNFQTHHFFEPEINMQVSQLVRLAGKRNKAITLAKSGIDIAQFQFYDLLRTLRYILRNDFYNIYFLEQSSKLYDLEISSLQKIIPPMQEQVSKGFLAPIEVLRIQSQLYTLQAAYDALQTNIEDVQSELKLIIRIPSGKYIIADADTLLLYKNVVSKINCQDLIDTAILERPDLKGLTATIIYNQNNLSLQKALAKPDITIGANYDRLGSYVHDFNSIGVGIPLPLFNRNQGNIKNAQIAVEQSKVEYESGLDKVKSDVATGYVTALRSEKLLQSFDPNFDANIRKMIDQVMINYQKKNITMLEFLDFYDSYKQNVLQLNQLRFNKMSALEQLNFATGKIIFN